MGLPEWSKVLQKGSEDLPEGREGLPEGPAGRGRTCARTYGRTYKRNFSPYYRTQSPIRTAAQKASSGVLSQDIGVRAA